MDKLYSNVDISNKLGGHVRVLLYQQLYDYETIEEALGPDAAAVILYETSDRLGHWCCVFIGAEDGEGVTYFFDPYGVQIDDQLDQIDPKFRIKNGEDYRYLSSLLARTTTPIVDYNDVQLQSHKEGVNTCGRWCVARIACRGLTTDEFAEMFSPVDGATSDDIVVAFTDSL